MLIWSLNAGSTGLKAQLIELSEDSIDAKGSLKSFENVVAKAKIRRIGSYRTSFLVFIGNYFRSKQEKRLKITFVL